MESKDPHIYQSLITTRVGQSLATELKASSYCEVSTKTYVRLRFIIKTTLGAQLFQVLY